MPDIFLSILMFYNYVVITYFVVINTLYLLLLLAGTSEVSEQTKRPQLTICRGASCDLVPSISILVPAYNEEKTIVSSINAMRNLEYPNLEIVVVNDGSKDRTLAALKRHFQLIPVSRYEDQMLHTEEINQVYHSLEMERLVVVDKANGGKADALNAGLNFCRSELFLSIDADTLIDKGALRHMADVYLTRGKEVVGIGGMVSTSNDSTIKQGQIVRSPVPSGVLPKIQVMEYLRSFLVGRAGWNKINGLPIISGAFGLFHRETAIEAGGYRIDTVGEDMDLVIRIHKLMKDKERDYELLFVPRAMCWTQVPSSYRVLATQRNRWQRGLAETLLHNREMIFNSGYGAVGLLSLPFFFVFELLGPIVEVTGYFVFAGSYMLGLVDTQFALMFLSVAVLYGVLLSVISLCVQTTYSGRHEYAPIDQLKLNFVAVFENFGFRQIHTIWRFRALIDWFFGKSSWGEMIRTKVGFEDDS